MSDNKMGHLDMLERIEAIDFIITVSICYILNKGRHDRLESFTRNFAARAKTIYGKRLAETVLKHATDWFHYLNNTSQAHFGKYCIRERGKWDK